MPVTVPDIQAVTQENSRTSILRKGIERVPRINKAGTAGGEKSFHFIDGFGDHAVRLTGLKLAL